MVASLTPCLRASSIAFAPASSCLRIAMIFSSENWDFFIRVLPWGKLYSGVVLIVRGLHGHLLAAGPASRFCLNGDTPWQARRRLTIVGGVREGLLAWRLGR